MKRSKQKREGRKLSRFAVKHLARDEILLYRLFEETAPVEESSVGDGVIFSVSVTRVVCTGSDREEEFLFDVTRDRAQAVRVLKMISHGKVTPSHASEIVGDIIGWYEMV